VNGAETFVPEILVREALKLKAPLPRFVNVAVPFTVMLVPRVTGAFVTVRVVLIWSACAPAMSSKAGPSRKKLRGMSIEFLHLKRRKSV
jgi:hypothetical protein